MHQQLTRLLRDYFAAKDAFKPRKAYALELQIRTWLAKQPIGPTDSSTNYVATPPKVESAASVSTTRPRRELTPRLKSIVD